jgi:allophanate hydrolase
VFISLRNEADAAAEAQALSSGARHQPLYGVPVAIKDNIDVAGLSTTAACPAFAYRPDKDATVVARLKAAGAIVVGKTNLDQFATGLVGVRSPYGVPRNPFDASLIPGGSSSGSAVAVAAGLVPLALGTDTAGSGRVPAGLNNVVGLKPSLGLVSNAGVVPACRTLDCVSILALTVDDAWIALKVIAGSDDADAYSRAIPLGTPGPLAKGVRLGVPDAGQRELFGDRQAAAIYDAAIARCTMLGADIVAIDFAPFAEAARLLYEGPWVAERYLVVRELLARQPDAIHPATREVISQGAKPSAADAFAALYRLEELRRESERTFRRIDALLLPTAPTVSQQPARHLYQFRQPARPLRPRGAGGDAPGRRAVGRHADRAFGTGCAFGRHRTRPACGGWFAARRARTVTATTYKPPLNRSMSRRQPAISSS